MFFLLRKRSQNRFQWTSMSFDWTDWAFGKISNWSNFEIKRISFERIYRLIVRLFGGHSPFERWSACDHGIVKRRRFLQKFWFFFSKLISKMRSTSFERFQRTGRSIWASKRSYDLFRAIYCINSLDQFFWTNWLHQNVRLFISRHFPFKKGSSKRMLDFDPIV